MPASSHNDLTQFQWEVLRAFFARETGFVLTGGAALVAFYLHHRQTHDLDLFTREHEAFSRSQAVLREVATALGAVIQALQEAPGFRRVALSRGDDMVVVDLVLEITPTAYEPLMQETVSADAPAEIFANKLTTLLSRAEERDLVDVYFLEKAGLDLEQALTDAFQRDGACTPAQLSWVLSSITIGDNARLPGEMESTVLRDYQADLISRLQALAYPR